MLAYFLPESAVLVLWTVLILSVIGFIAIFSHELILPYLRIQESKFSDPPFPGKKFPVVIDELSRNRVFRVGQKSGDLPTRCIAIAEDHLVFTFKKSKDAETYVINVKKNGPVFFKPPRMQKYHKMNTEENIQSYEIIGHSAFFRISDKIAKDRMVNYIEISLSSEFFFNKGGNERMKFFITVTSIQPGINTDKKLNGKVYPFGKSKNAPDTSDSDYSEDDQE